MSALDELRVGKAGPYFVTLLQKTIFAVAVGRNFPAPFGFKQWDTAAVASTCGDFLASAGTRRRLTDLNLHCQTDDALAFRLQKTVRNFLADSGRRTPVGRLVLRINEVLGKDGSFVRRGSQWGVAGGATEPAEIDIDALVSAVSGLKIVVPTTWKTGGRQSPDLDSSSVVALASRVIDAAGGTVSPSVIAQVAAGRLGLGAAPLSLDALAFDPAQPSSAAATNTGEAVLIEMRAHEIFSRLNDSERIAMWADVATSEVGILLGASKSTGHNVRSRAIAIMQDELIDDDHDADDRVAIAKRVFELARNWTNSWTEDSDAT